MFGLDDGATSVLRMLRDRYEQAGRPAAHMSEAVMSDPAVEEFGKWFVQDVRDAIVEEIDSILDGRMGGMLASRWRKELSPEAVAVIREHAPELIDRAMSTWLSSLQASERARLIFQASDGRTIDVEEASDGLCGHLLGDAGWLHKYARQRRSLLARDPMADELEAIGLPPNDQMKPRNR